MDYLYTNKYSPLMKRIDHYLVISTIDNYVRPVSKYEGWLEELSSRNHFCRIPILVLLSF